MWRSFCSLHHRVTARSAASPLAARMRVVPDRRLGARQRNEVLFDNRFGLHRDGGSGSSSRTSRRGWDSCSCAGTAERGTARHGRARPASRRALQRREAGLRHRLRPVVGGRHAERLRREQRGDLDVAGADAQVGGVLADAAALHRACETMTAGNSRGRALVDGAEHERLRAAAAGAGHADAAGVDVRQAGEEVERADRCSRSAGP